LKSKKILFIEDDNSQRISFSKILRKNGFKVTVASSGADGIKKFNKNPAEIILCDLNMPGIDGIQVVKLLMKKNPDLICIVTSAHGSIKSAMKAIENGAYDFITKPLQIEEFNSSLKRALEQKRLRDEIHDYAADLEDMVEKRTEKLNYANKQLAALNKLSNRLSKFRDEEKLIDIIPELLTKSLDFDESILLLENGGRLSLRSFNLIHDSRNMTKIFEQFIKNDNFPMIPPMKQCFSENRTIFKKNYKRKKQWEINSKDQSKNKPPSSFVLTPIRVKNIPIGVLGGTLPDHPRELEHQDIVRFETFAHIVGMSIDKIRGYQDLERKVKERTAALRNANTELKVKAHQLEIITQDLAEGNVNLLSIQEMLEDKNKEMQSVLSNLSQRRNELQALLDSSLSGIIMVNTKNIIIAANRVFSEHYNLDSEKFIQKDFNSFNKKISSRFKYPGKYDKKIKELKKAKRHTAESSDHSTMFKNALEVIKPEQRFITLYSSPVTDRNEKVVGRVWAYTDITKEKESEEQIHAIIEVSPIPFVVSTIHDGKILYVNKPLANLLGYKVSELVGRKTPNFYHIPEDRQIVLAALKKDGELRNFETQIVDKDGNPIWMVFSLVTTRIGGEAVIVGALYDISKMKSAFDKLAMANETLKDTQTQLVQSEKMASLGMLVAGVAHEINNPIGAVRSMQDTSERALGKLKGLISKDIKMSDEMNKIMQVLDSSNEVINLGAERVEKIVKQLKSFARLDEAELQKADIHEGLNQALMLSHYKMKDRIKIKKVFGKIPKIRCFPAKLNQVFLNMIINADQAMPIDGTLTITTYEKNNKAYIELKDTGVGISEENISRIFDPGYTTKGANVGTGLGLSICYQIIQEHKGEIEVESKVGKGTTFKIILPTNIIL